MYALLYALMYALMYALLFRPAEGPGEVGARAPQTWTWRKFARPTRAAKAGREVPETQTHPFLFKLYDLFVPCTLCCTL